MEYESKDCDEQKPGAGRAGNTSHDGQDYMLGMLCLVFAGGEDKSLSQQISKTALKSDDAPHIFRSVDGIAFGLTGLAGQSDESQILN